MEFLRFGSSIPGGYWGCCAVCIIQNFKVDPDTKASIQLVSGDGGGPLTKGSEMLFAGPTYHDIFKQRIRIGTFHSGDMPNHAFFAILTESQVSGGVGHKWLKILKEEGFEFLRTQDNSVYTGDKLDNNCSPHPNHIFALFRNITGSRIKDPFTPPKQWTDLPSVVPEAWELVDKKGRIEFTDKQTAIHKQAWKDYGPTKLLTESEILKSEAPVIMAGLRLPGAAPETKEAREARKAQQAPKASAFPTKAAAPLATATAA